MKAKQIILIGLLATFITACGNNMNNALKNSRAKQLTQIVQSQNQEQINSLLAQIAKNDPAVGAWEPAQNSNDRFEFYNDGSFLETTQNGTTQSGHLVKLTDSYYLIYSYPQAVVRQVSFGTPNQMTVSYDLPVGDIVFSRL